MQFKIKFRPLKLEDAKFINLLRQQEEMEKLIGGAKRPVSYERDLRWVEDLIMKDDQSKIYFAITPTESDEAIGYTSISNIDYRNGSCFWSGIKINPEKSGKGYGTQVALKILKYVFEELRMERCEAKCLEHHEVALKMMLKVGYKKEGLIRKSLFKNGVYNNEWLLSVIKEEYFSIKNHYKL